MTALWNEIARLAAEHPVGQALGLVALVLTCLSYQARTTRAIALRQTVAAFFWTVHMLLLGAWSGCLLNFLGLVRSGVYSQRGERPWASRPFWPWLFGVLCVSAAVWSGLAQGEGPRLLFPTAAQCLACYALWTVRVRFARFLLVAVSLCWLAYDVLSGSIPGTVCEVFSQISLYIAILRDFRFRFPSCRGRISGIHGIRPPCASTSTTAATTARSTTRPSSRSGSKRLRSLPSSG